MDMRSSEILRNSLLGKSSEYQDPFFISPASSQICDSPELIAFEQNLNTTNGLQHIFFVACVTAESSNRKSDH